MSVLNKPVKPYTFVDGVGNVAYGSQVNADFDILYNKVGDMVDVINTTNYQAIIDSVTAAEDAQLAAEAAKAAAELALDSFDDRYLGVKSSDPTLDNDSNALVIGSLYFNSVTHVMRVYNGSLWQDNNALSDGSVTNAKLAFDGGAFGFRNKLINGNFDVWQRGSSLSSGIGAATYLPDRWLCYATGAAVTLTRQTGPSGHLYCLRATGAASNTRTSIIQRIESLNAYSVAGTTHTVQAHLYSSTSRNITWTVSSADAVDNFSSATNVDSSVVSLTTGWNYITFNFNSTSACNNGYQLEFNFGAVVSGESVAVAGVQLEQGITATPFEYRPYGTELALCHRYFRSFASTAISRCVYANGGWSSTTTTVDGLLLRFEAMRATPVPLFTGSHYIFDGTSLVTAGVSTVPAVTVDCLWISTSQINAPVIAGRPCTLYAGTEPNSAILLSAEL